MDDFGFNESKFLNRQGLVEEIKNIFKHAKSEVIILVPYIKISEDVWNEMKNAEKEKKHVVIVYRENEMKRSEKERLYSLSNVTLLHHPHIHSKCYLNESSIIIGSMNLYEHSELNNREMGILSHVDTFDNSIYEDAKKEIRDVIKASTIEKKSDNVQNGGFNVSILTTEDVILRKYIDQINRIFVNKEFSIIKGDYEQTEIICDPYYENIIVYLDYDILEKNVVEIRRIRLRLKFNLEKQIELQTNFWSKKDNLGLDHFQIYWYKKKDINIYPNSKDYTQWNNLSFEQNLKKLKQGLNIIIDYLRKK